MTMSAFVTNTNVRVVQATLSSDASEQRPDAVYSECRMASTQSRSAGPSHSASALALERISESRLLNLRARIERHDSCLRARVHQLQLQTGTPDGILQTGGNIMAGSNGRLPVRGREVLHAARTVDSSAGVTSEVVPLLSGSWSRTQERVNVRSKELMGVYFAEHDFLVDAHSGSPATQRERSADILVNSGTTQLKVVEKALDWLARNWNDEGPFTITWHTGGTLVQSALITRRGKEPHLASATNLFLFPGQVDVEVETVIGKEPLDFIRKHRNTYFTCAILSAYKFDMATGTAFFHYDAEIELQRECAILPARRKYLFLDPAKFVYSGTRAYSVEDLLGSCEELVIYTTEPLDPSSSDSQVDKKLKQMILDGFDTLSRTLHSKDIDKNVSDSRRKTLRLVMVGSSGRPPEVKVAEGFLGKNSLGSVAS